MKRAISFSFADVTGKEFTFKELGELHFFAKRENDFWVDAAINNKNRKNDHSCFNDYHYFNNLVSMIDGWKDSIESWDESELNQHLNRFNKDNRGNHNGINKTWIWSGHPFIDVFLKCNKSYGEEGANAFLTFVSKDYVSNLKQKDGFIGSLLAYEFEFQDSSLTKRRKTEKASISILRNQLEEETQKIIGETDDLKIDFSDWDRSTRAGWENFLIQESSKRADQQDAQKNEHEEQKKTHEDKFISYMDDCKARISELENTYQEKLRLEKPATYWKKSAKKYGFQGSLWAIALVASILLGLVYFYNFFEAWLKGQEVAIKLNTLQGVVIFGSILAVYSFLVKTISKLTFSSFHLMRDSEEREQLTYLYLSLNNEGQVNEASRELILQALFSRSETGLLTGESGPRMPVTDLLKAVSKAR